MPPEGPPPPETDSGCKLLDGFAILIQLLLASTALATLAIKRARERPQRPVKIWVMDGSKQFLGGVVIHSLNLLVSYSRGRPRHGGSSNLCVWYFLNVGVDTTLGVAILWCILNCLQWSLQRLGVTGIRTGDYGNPPSMRRWAKQTVIFIISLAGMKLCVFGLLRFFPFFFDFGKWVLRWTRDNYRAQVVFVMLIFPLCMNAFQIWIIDTIVKNKILKLDDEEAQADDERTRLLPDQPATLNTASPSDFAHKIYIHPVMFSIARHDESEQDDRSYEKRIDRLSKLNERFTKKRKKVEPEQLVNDAPEAEIHQLDESSAVDQPTNDSESNAVIPVVEEEAVEEEKRHKKQKRNKPKKNKANKPANEVPEETIPESIAIAEADDVARIMEAEELSVEADTDIVDGVAVPEEPAEESMLQAFPDFTPAEPDVKDIAQLKSMGIPDWLANPTVIDQGTTTALNSIPGLSEKLLDRCKEHGIDEFFAVQTAVVPIFLRSPSLYDTRRPPGDLCVSAPTGSGKTLAYVIPIVQILSQRVVTRLRALIVLPTRDLVSQVRETFEAIVKGTGLKVATATGHHSFAQEQAQLIDNPNDKLLGGSSKVDILIATPGRLIDHLKGSPNFSLQHLRFLVIDEADRLLNQSYQDWLAHILRATQPEKLESRLPADHLQRDSRNVPIHDAIAPTYMDSQFDLPVSDLDTPKMPSVQKLLFSATLTKNPAKIAGLHLTNPQYVAVRSGGQIGKDDDGLAEKYTTPDTLKEYMIVCPSDQKPMLVLHLLYNLNVKAALCFTKSVESAHRLFMLITFFERARGNANDKQTIAAEYSSDLTQSARRSILKRFKQGEIRLLICSDLIARGIDLDSVDTVVSYDVPLYMKKYIHRVGRTARAGRDGDAYTLVEQQEARHFKEMLRKSGHLSEVKNVKVPRPTLEPFIENYQTALSELGTSLTVSKTSLVRYQTLMQSEEKQDEDVGKDPVDADDDADSVDGGSQVASDEDM